MDATVVCSWCAELCECIETPSLPLGHMHLDCYADCFHNIAANDAGAKEL